MNFTYFKVKAISSAVASAIAFTLTLTALAEDSPRLRAPHIDRRGALGKAEDSSARGGGRIVKDERETDGLGQPAHRSPHGLLVSI